MLKNLSNLVLSGKESLPIIEGGKGVSVSNGKSAGAFAKAGAVGTFSGVSGEWLDENNNLVPLTYKGTTRNQRHEELMIHSIEAALCQAKIANEISQGKGAIHMNILWEMGGAERILIEVLKRANGLINGITCGAGMPYKLAEICAQHSVYYYPIISSMRAFRALWKRSYSKHANFLGAVVYEDPWKAGGHNGLSNAEDPNAPQDPYNRIKEIRAFMNSVGLENTPIVMAGGVWNIGEYSQWLDNPEIGKICFQFGTRPIVTVENPAPKEWKQKLLTLKEGDVFLNKFSPTGFYSSAVNNNFIKTLRERSERQVEFSSTVSDVFNTVYSYGARNRKIYIKRDDFDKVNEWYNEGHTELLKTPDNTAVFVTIDEAEVIRNDQINCMGCLSYCAFSNWTTNAEMNFTTGKLPDPRSFCIQKTLQNIAQHGDVVNELMFAGHNAFRFATDPFYENGFIPTTQQLIDRIVEGK
ncbi:MAG: nitronate monooxygenase [Rickettsiales bacterium]|nr:nitronate monooxygenase [Rickettsiales bacterium]